MALGLLPPVVATLVADIHQFSAEMDKAKAQMSAVGTSGGAMMNKIGAGVALAGVGIAVASVKMASDFQTQMTRLYTAAGAPEAAVKNATGAVLALGDSVGYSGTQIAEALYHPVSAGLDLATSLQVVKYAAQEAQISGASLDDTTYSLSSVMKAFNQPASEAANTMAQLNAIVGQGDMHFQDFNVSIKNWAPTAAQMGISVTSMGAALAYLTDRGNSAEEASTRVTMGLTMMATPSKQAAKLLEGLGVASSDVTASSDAMTGVLKKAGITQNELAADLAKPDGIYVALNHLKNALIEAGVSGTEADSTLSKIFGGGRSDKAILSLMQNLDGLKGKFNDIQSAASPDKFANAWQQTQQTFAFQLKQVGAEVENLAIRFGTMLIPIIQDVAGFFTRNQWAAEALGAAIGVVLVGSLVKFSITATTTALTAIGKIVTAFAGMGAAAKTAATETEASAAATAAAVEGEAAAVTAAATETKAAEVATASWSTSLGRAIPIIGGVLAGAAMLGEKLGSSGLFGMDKVGDHTALDVDRFTQSLLQAANGSRDAQDQVTKLTLSVVAMGSMTGGTAQGLRDVDSSLTHLYSSGNQAAAKTEFDAFTKALENTGMSASDAAAKFPGYTQAVADAATQQKLAAASANDAGGAVGGTVDPTNRAADAAAQAADAIKAVSDAYTALTGNITASNAIDTFKKDLLDTTAEIQKNGKSLKDDTLEGLANRLAFRNAADEILKYRDAQIKNGVSTDDANKVAATQATQLIKVWEQLGANKDQVEKYAKELGLVPANLYTSVQVDTSSAAQAVQDLRNQLDGLYGASHPGGGFGGAHGAASGVYDKGGWVSGAKGAPQLAIVHGGEFVLSNDMLAGGGSAGMASLPAAPSGGRGGATTLLVEVYVDGKKTQGAHRTQVLRYQYRNSKNNLSLTGIGG